MHDDLRALWEEAREGKRRFVAAVDQLSEQDQGKPAKDHTWTPVQIGEHILIVERMYRDYVAASSADSLAGKKTSRNPLIRVIIWGSRKRFKAPTIREMEPGSTPWTAVKSDWDSVRTDLESAMEPVTDPDKPWMLHPMLGALSSRQVMTLLTAHFAYHLPQVGGEVPPRSPQGW
ncbi:MAG: DinB family protein [Fimbriimonas sp.]